MIFLAKLVGRLVSILMAKGILNMKDFMYLADIDETKFRQILLTKDLIDNGIFTKEELERILKEGDKK